MPEIMKAHMGQTNTHQKPPERFHQGTWAIEITCRISKHQIFVSPVDTNGVPLFLLLFLVLYQNVNHKGWEHNFAPTACRFWLRLHIAVHLMIAHRTLHLKRPLIEIDILPAQGQ